ncbi:hypothetical protein F7725_005424 [Dissostichus mawsoni]|uniref:SEA domain-containing protein n=1 Tax=Dissostichus mawsoni TaxID=36200 RepID=A0A7J5YTP4_DISMA|nr:hypothetical protein F7725_005424 [Dissostichus mawsoni]
MQETFTPQLANKSSPAFLELKNKVTTALDMVYSEQYGSSFNRIVINSFSQGSVVVDAEVIFNDVTTLPNATSVASALATASSSSNFSLTVNVSSISATAVLAPTQTPTTVAPSTPLVNFTSPPLTTAAPSAAPNATAVSTAAPVPLTTTASIISTTSNEGTLALKFSIDQTFTADLSNSSSTAYQTLAAEVVKELNKVCTNLYGSSFVRSVVNSFTSGSVVADTTISFKDTSSVPSSSTATSQLSSALTSNSTSLSVISGNLSNSSSTAYQTLAAEVVKELNKVCTNLYGSSFVRSVVNSFTSGSVVADTTISFKDTSSVPSSSTATSQLSSALTSNSTSLSVISGNLSDSSSTAYKTLAATVISEVNKAAQKLYGSSFLRSIINKFTSGSVVADTTIAFKDTSSVPSSSTATSQLSSALTSNSTSLSVISGSVSINLSDSSSTAYKTLAATVISEVNKVAQKLYGSSFLRSIINKFTINIHVKQSPSAHNGLFGLDSTILLVNLTSTPGNGTSNPPITTMSPVNATSPINMTSPTINVTSLPVNMTSPTHSARHWNINTTKHHNYKLSNCNYNPNTYHNRAHI